MVKFERATLSNGLKILIHEDHTTPMAVVNILYDVGARDEDASKTGFAHLFEHLMFGGSVNIPSYDEPLQLVGGENNAFTSNDITNYYITLPAVNLETAFWLESDRMLSLAFSEKSLEVQKNVVCEEFKQRYLNQPYGDVWLKLRPLAYKVHPYAWPTIGRELAHIEQIEMQDVRDFFKRFYNPSNAIMVVGGAVNKEEVLELAEKWFGPIPGISVSPRALPQEPRQCEPRRLETNGDVPLDAIYIAFHMGERNSDAYYEADLLSDILSRGNSSRLYSRLIKERQLFSDINAYVTGSLDAGLFIVEGKPGAGVSLADAEAAIWQELELLCAAEVSDEELTKVKNKVESSMLFSEMSLLDKAMNLSFFELLGGAEALNQESERYTGVTAARLRGRAAEIFTKSNSSTLLYHANK